jgi:hypothetical protein
LRAETIKPRKFFTSFATPPLQKGGVVPPNKSLNSGVSSPLSPLKEFTQNIMMLSNTTMSTIHLKKIAKQQILDKLLYEENNELYYELVPTGVTLIVESMFVFEPNKGSETNHK